MATVILGSLLPRSRLFIAGCTARRRQSTRIRDRAIRRCGELLKQIEPAPNQHVAGMGAHTSRSNAAKDAGLSKHQQVQAIRVANDPTANFERQVESPKPPTVTRLAEQGKKAATGPDRTGFRGGAAPQ